MSKSRRKLPTKSRSSRRTAPIKTRAWRVLADYLRELGVDEPRDRIGRLRFMGEGLSNRTYLASLLRPGDRPEKPTVVVVKVPRRHAPKSAPEAAQREQRLLDYLATCQLPFRLPRTLATVLVDGGRAVIQTFVSGVELDLEPTRRQPQPWLVIGEVARAIHGVDIAPICGLIPGALTRHACADHLLDGLADLEGDDIDAFRAWARDNRPSDGPSCLLHGDLLGQNVLVSLEPDEEVAIIDWGLAEIGDPALELAIVTFGYQQPFRVAGSFERFLEVYNDGALTPLTRDEVHFYELCLLLGEYGDRLDSYGSGSHHADLAKRRVHHLLRRVGAL